MDRIGKLSATGFVVAGVGAVGFFAWLLQSLDTILSAINLDQLPPEWVAGFSFFAMIIGGLTGLLTLRDGEPEPGSMDAYLKGVERLDDEADEE
jgi:hypothetical protein